MNCSFCCLPVEITEYLQTNAFWYRCHQCRLQISFRDYQIKRLTFYYKSFWIEQVKDICEIWLDIYKNNKMVDSTKITQVPAFEPHNLYDIIVVLDKLEKLLPFS